MWWKKSLTYSELTPNEATDEKKKVNKRTEYLWQCQQDLRGIKRSSRPKV